ncbi:MAG: hypothetical protein ACON5F_15805 [Jejuia sp.]
MISNEEKNTVLKKLLNSNTFSKSTTSNNLLKYLVASSQSEKTINTTDIALELFGSHYEPEKSEATVRVNMYYLRKKLDKYFKGEGLHDNIHIEIKRGQYGVEFKRINRHISSKVKKIMLLTSIVPMAILAYFIYNRLNPINPVWDANFKNEKETTLYLYDIFGYYGPTLFNKIGWHRDYEINSPSQFYKKIENRPDLIKDYAPGRNLYVNFLSSYSVNNLSRYFAEHDSEFSIEKFHNLSPLKLKSQNSIYLGPFRYENAFIDFFNLKSKRFKLIPKQRNETSKNIAFLNNEDISYNEDRNIAYKNFEKNIDTVIRLNSDGHSFEHVLVAKLNGDNDTKNMLFLSNHGFGATAAVDYFTNTDSIAKFNANYLKDAEEFIALFYVSGKERAAMKIEQVYFDDNK